MIRSTLKLATWFIIGYLAVASNASGAFLQEPTVQIAIDTEEIFVGESFTLQAVVEGIETANAPTFRSWNKILQSNLKPSNR